jgi:prolipoprotein diacylglyceryltransferase
MPLLISGTVVWLSVSAVLAYTLAGPAARRTGADRKVLDDLTGTVTLWALLGSRLIYAILNPAATVRQPIRLLMLKGIVSGWGAALGSLAALVYLISKRRLRGTSFDGAILILASAMPALILAWDPEGIPTTALFALVGPTHPVAWYYAAASGAVAATLWLRPGQLTRHFTVLAGALFLLVDNFRAAPLLFGTFTGLQLVGVVMVSFGILTSDAG